MTLSFPVFLRSTSLAILLLCESAFASAVLYHIPPASARSGKALDMEAVVLGDATVVEARVYHRIRGQSAYREAVMTFREGSWQATIPQENVVGEGLEYALIFLLDDGSSLAFPSENPLESPYVLTVEVAAEAPPPFRQRARGSQTLTADVLIISPEKGEVVTTAEVLIVASLFNVRALDVESVRLFLDNREVTSDAVITREILTYSPALVDPGLHTVRIELNNVHGFRLQPVTWSFNVTGRASEIVTPLDEFAYSGKSLTEFSLDRVEGDTRTIGQSTITFKGGWQWLGLQTNFRLTSDENPFRQPRNRYSVTFLSGDNIAVSIGDFTPVLSSYTIDGKRVRGLGIDVDLNWIRFQMVRGELERAVQGSLGSNESYRVTDVITDETGAPLYILDRVGYTFSRNYLAYRLSLNLFNRFRLGLNLQKANDDLETVRKEWPDARFTVPDWRDYVTVTGEGMEPGTYTYSEFVQKARFELADNNWGGDDPKDNLVFGFDGELSFDDRRLTFNTAWAMSFLNRNIWDGAMTLAQLDTALDDSADGYLGRTYDEEGMVTGTGFSLEDIIDPSAFQDLFIVNAFMVPLIPVDVEAANETPVAAIMNMPSAAYQLKMRAYYYDNTFQIGYSQVGPQFNSLANPYLSANRREFDLSDRIRLFDNTLTASFSYKNRNNKILRSVVDPYTQNTVVTSVIFAPGVDLPTVTMNLQSVTRSNGKTELDTLVYTSVAGVDSLAFEDKREDSRTNNRLISLSIPIPSRTVKYNVLATLNWIDVEDLLVEDRAQDYVPFTSNSRSVSVVTSARYTIPLQATLSLSRYVVTLPGVAAATGTGGESTLTSGGFQVTYTTEKRLTFTGGLSYLKVGGISQYSQYGSAGSIRFRLFDALSAKVSFTSKIRRTEDEIKLGTLAMKFSANYVF
ncbi:MAG: hypothetical protein ACE5HZ_08015 [Fidelibacterota bacterium]